MELTDFLLARIAEDDFVQFLATHDEELLGPLAQHVVSEDDHRLPHAARWRPEAVKAHCDARRRIVELHSPFRVTTANDGLDWNYSGCEACHAPDSWAPADGDWYPCLTLRLLALPYADYPDYDEVWRPPGSTSGSTTDAS